VYRPHNRADILNHLFSSTHFRGKPARALLVCHSIVLAVTNRPERHAFVSVSALFFSR
jgi:hypothetical protein